MRGKASLKTVDNSKIVNVFNLEVELYLPASRLQVN
jgi:hypothetical protein